MAESLRRVGDTQLWITERGSGEHIVLCNGGPGCCDYLEPVAEMISDLGRVIRFEPRGCGRSALRGPYDLTTTLSDMDAIRESLGIRRWLVGGHSWGALLSLAYALQHPDRVTGVLYLSGTGIQNDRQWHAAYKQGRASGIEQEIAYSYPVNQEVNRIGNESTRMYIRQPYLFRQLAEMEIPLLAVQGSDDIRPNWPVEQLTHLLPQASMRVIEGAGHNLWLTHAEEVRDAIRPFVAAQVQTGLPENLTSGH